MVEVKRRKQQNRETVGEYIESRSGKSSSSLKNVLIVALIAIPMLVMAGSVSYYFVIKIPQQEKERLEFEKEKYEDELRLGEEEREEERMEKATEELEKDLEELANETKYYECMDEAYERYIEDWNGTCAINGLPNDCGLQTSLSEGLDDGRSEDEQTCFNLYMR